MYQLTSIFPRFWLISKKPHIQRMILSFVKQLIIMSQSASGLANTPCI